MAAKKKKIDDLPVMTPTQNTAVFDEFYMEQDKAIIEAKNACSTWRSNQDKWHRLRMCIKKTKSFPFTGCANIRLPIIETKLRKLKSNLVKVVFGLRPIVSAVPSPSGSMEVAQKIEKFLDHLIMDKMNFKSKGIIAIDQSIEKGMYLLKPHWRTEITTRQEEISLDDMEMQEAFFVFDPNTPEDAIKAAVAEKFDVDMSDLVADDNEAEIERIVSEILSGKDKVKVEFKDVLFNGPDVALANPEYVYVPSDSGYNPQGCHMIVHDFFMPYNEVKQNVKLKGWSAQAVENIEYLATISDVDVTESTKSTREGVERLNNPSQLVRIYEVYKWYDLNNDGTQEKCIFTFAPEFGQTLRKITLPFNNGKWPFVKLVNELCDDRWFSHRGLPELIADLVREIDSQHCQKVDSQTWRNAPMISYRAGVVNPNLIKIMPAQAIPRHDPDDIIFMQNTNLNTDFSYEKEQMILESKIEELVGQIDFTLQSMINRRQPRTAFEVDQQQNSAQMVFSLDADLYIEAFSELFAMVWDLWCQFGDDETEFAYFGENGWEKIRLTKEEIQGKYKIVIRGNDQNFNPVARQNRAAMIMANTLNPIMIQSGIVQPINIYNAAKKYYQTQDIREWEELITNPQQLPPPQPPPPPMKMKLDDLTPGEQAQVKSQYGIQPDIQGMEMKKMDEMDEANKQAAIDGAKAGAQAHLELEKERIKANARRKPEKFSPA